MAIKGNDHDKDDKKEQIIEFPTLAQRDRIRKLKEAKETEWREKYKKQRSPKTSQPFFNARKIPPLTRAIVIAFFIVQLPLYFLMDAGQRLEFFYNFGFVAGAYTGEVPWHTTALIAPLTHLFIHGGWMHLAFNTVMMLAMGVFMERTFGARRMAIFFVFSGLFGALFYFLLNPMATVPLVGASGSISGLFGVIFMILYEQGQLGSASRKGPLPLILFWVGLMVITGVIGGDIAWQAHLGGFFGGLGLYYALKRKWIRL